MATNGLDESQLPQAVAERREAVIEYLQLAVLERLNDKQVERMEAIFQQAEEDPLLGFLIDEADHIAGHELGLIESERIIEQQSKLAKAIDEAWIQLTIEKSRSNKPAQLPKNAIKAAQLRLQKRGLYSGLIDGVYGKVTEAAFSNLEREFREELRRLGLTSPSDIQDLDPCETMERVKAQGSETSADLQEKMDLLSLRTWQASD